MIYIFENTEILDETFVEKSIPFLSTQRLNKVLNYKVISDKINSCIAFLLLRYALKNEFGIDEIPEFFFNEYEKPFLKNHSNIFFSISHCKNAVVCAVSDKNIAVDIMDFRKARPLTIKRVCSQKEQIFLNQNKNTNKDFTKLWVMKECYSKLKGKGLSMDFSKITVKLDECKNIKYIETENWLLGYSKIDNEQILRLDIKKIFNI